MNIRKLFWAGVLVLFVSGAVCFGGPVIELDPSELIFTAVQGACNPDGQILYISNASMGKLEWAVEPNGLCEWIGIEPSSGSCVDETDEVTIGVDITGLVGGYYSCELMVTDPDADNSPQYVMVSLRVFDGDGTLHVPGEYATLQSAVDAADNGETVLIADGTYTGEGNRDVLITKAITIESENGADNCIIDCEGTDVDQHRGFEILNVDDVEVIIKGLTVANGYLSDVTGGAIRFYGCTGSIKDCVFINNTAKAGGGIYFSSLGDIEIIGCEFTGNHAVDDGGALLCSRGNASIRDCRFESNTAESRGGAIYSKYDAYSSIDNCEIVSNTADYEGGGIYIELGKISDCIVKNNIANLGGGINGVNICVDNCWIVGNIAEDRGGGVRIWGIETYFSISNCTITGNKAWNMGGGIAIHSETIGRITNSIIWGNGGCEGRELTIYNSIVFLEYCSIDTDLQDIYSYNEDFELPDTNIDADPEFVDAYLLVPDCDPEYPYYGLLVVEDAHLQAGSPCIDTGWNDPVDGLERFDVGGQVRLLDGDGDGEAVVDIGAYEFAPEGVPVTATDKERVHFTCYENGERTGQESLIIYNTGDGVLQWQLTEDCDWLDADIYSGTADANGVEVTFNVDSTGLTPDVYTCPIQISDENALNDPVIVTAVLYVVPDVGLWVPFHYETIQAAVDAAGDHETVLIAEGTYTGEGNRDIYINKPITVKGATEAQHCIVDVERREGHRGFYLDGVDPNRVLQYLTVTGGCLYNSDGAGIYCAGSAIIRDCIINNNHNIDGAGGGIRFEGGDARIEESVISGNYARYRGAGIHCYGGESGTIMIIDSIIADNILGTYDYYESRGGGIYSYGIDISIINSQIIRNRGYDGGGICARYGSNLTITDSTISDNDGGGGGGIHCNNSNLEMTGCTVNNNTAGAGGGIFAIENCIVDISDSEISNNIASGDTTSVSETCEAFFVYDPYYPYPAVTGAAGGINSDNCQLSIFNCVITGNEGGTGGINSCAGNILISDSILAENSSQYFAGGIYAIGAGEVQISRCVIIRNEGYWGNPVGGVFCTKGQNVSIDNCVISGNKVGNSGVGGVCLSECENNYVTNCTIVGNEKTEDMTWPGIGGMVISGYSIYPSHEPYFENYVKVENNIIRNNRGDDGRDNAVISGYINEVLYNNIEGGWDGLGYNIDVDPMFTEPGYWDPNGTPNDETDDFWVEGDYHLKWDSPCVDTGDPYYQCGPNATDIDGNTRILDGDNDGSAIVDMGAYERHPHDEPVLIVSEEQMSFKCMLGGAEIKEDTFQIRNQGAGELLWQISESCEWLTVSETEGTVTTEIDEVVVTVDAAGLGLGVYNCQIQVVAEGAVNSPHVIEVTLYVVRYLSVPDQYPTIQAAIDDANDFDVVVVVDGTYTGDGNRDIVFAGKAITVKSANGPENCIIDCAGSETEPHRGFLFGSDEGSDSRLEGFTIINGFSDRGAGINCYTSSPTISNCVLVNNYATEYAGALWCRLSSPRVINCIFSENHSVGWGGGICCYENDSPIFENCTFQNNTTDSNGAGIWIQDGNIALSDCSFYNNTCVYGGAIHSNNTDIILSGCSFTGNNARSGAGIRFSISGELLLDNCIFTGNVAEVYGGALYCNVYYDEDLRVYINNCTFSGNDAGEGSAVFYYGTEMMIANSILWANTNTYQSLGGNIFDMEIYYCDVQDYMGDENYGRAFGNIDIDPNFVDTSSTDAADWDLHLMPYSPCVDGGQTAYVQPGTVDIDGEARVMGEHVDMGADEVGPKQADFTRDGVINIDDFGVLGDAWGTGPGDEKWYVLCDLWEDGVIGLDDVAVFIEDWLWEY